MQGPSGVKRNADHLPGILSRGRPEKKGHVGESGQVSPSSAVAFFFKNADLVGILQKKLYLKCLQKLASVNRRLREVLGNHYDLEFAREHWLPHRRWLNERRRVLGTAWGGGFAEAENEFDISIREELVNFFEPHPERDVARALAFVYAPGGPHHAHVRRFIEQRAPFLMKHAMRAWPRKLRVFYYEEFMWHTLLTVDTLEMALFGERFFDTVTTLEEMAKEDGKMRFHWTSQRLGRSLLGARHAFERLRKSNISSGRELAWIDARIDASLPAPPVDRGDRLHAFLASPFDHVIAGHIVD